MNNKYINKAGVCPVCGSNNLKYEPVVFNGENAIFCYTCEDCHIDGEEVYYMEFIQHRFWDEEKEETINVGEEEC